MFIIKINEHYIHIFEAIKLFMGRHIREYTISLGDLRFPSLSIVALAYFLMAF